MERIVLVGVPPEVINDLQCRHILNTPVSGAIVRHDSDIVFDTLLKSGVLRGHGRVIVKFVPDENVKVDSKRRPVRIITVSDGSPVSESIPPCELSMEIKCDRNN